MSTCRGCGQRITWLETAGGLKMPVDEDPTPDGTILAVGRMAHVMTKAEIEARDWEKDPAPRYTSHFVTCPDATRWRRRA